MVVLINICFYSFTYSPDQLSPSNNKTGIIWNNKNIILNEYLINKW